MKKFLALLLAVMMIASMSVTAFAADDVDADDIREAWEATAPTESKEADVNVVITNDDNKSMTADPVYFVVVEWKSMDFSFKFTNTTDTEIKWDPTQHAYVNADNEKLEGAWQATNTANETFTNVSATTATQEAAVKVTNHSNETITVSASVTAEEKNGVKTTISADPASALPSAVGKGTDEDALKELTYAWDVTVEGTPTVVTGFEVDTVKLTIKK